MGDILLSFSRLLFLRFFMITYLDLANFCALFVGYTVYYMNSILPGLIINLLTNTTYVIGSFILSGDFVTTNKVMAKDTFEWSTFLMLAGIAGFSLYLCMKIIKKLEILAPASVQELEQNTKKSFTLKPFLNIPILLIVVIFILRVSM